MISKVRHEAACLRTFSLSLFCLYIIIYTSQIWHVSNQIQDLKISHNVLMFAFSSVFEINPKALYSKKALFEAA